MPRPLTERDIERYLHRRVKALGGTYRRVKWLGRRRAPDDRNMLAPRPFWAECKAPGKGPTKAQAREHARMRRNGEVVYVFDSFESIDEVLRGYADDL